VSRLSGSVGGESRMLTGPDDGMIHPVTDGVAVPGPFALHRLAEVHHVLDEDAEWLVAVQFRFDEGYLGIEVDPDHDEVELSFDESAPTALRYWDVVVRRDAADAYADVLGLSSAWRWLLFNQQGYRDGFQIEFGPADSTITVQYLAAASKLERRRVRAVMIG
jgi:hypothetical protein